jgi:CspA family cold shock protein
MAWLSEGRKIGKVPLKFKKIAVAAARAAPQARCSPACSGADRLPADSARGERVETDLGRVARGHATAEETSMAVGTVKWFNSSKGYGFIRPEDGGADIFVHVTAVQRAGMQSLMEGQRVAYEVVRDRGKLAAANLAMTD